MNLKNKKFIAMILTIILCLTSLPCNLQYVSAADKNSISLNYSDYTLKSGKTLNLKIKSIPKSLKDKKIIWTSSKKSVVSVNKNGTVKALKKGSATITAKVNKHNEIMKFGKAF